MKKTLSITLILLIAVAFTGCSQVEKIQDTVAIGQSLNTWFQSIQSSDGSGSMLDNMVENGDEILYEKNLEVDVAMTTQDGQSININPDTFETREELIAYVEDEDNLTDDWKAFRNYELRSFDDIKVENEDGEEIDVNDESLSNAQTFLSLIGDKNGNSRDAFANVELSLYNKETELDEDYSGTFRITFTEKDEDWYVQKLFIDLDPVEQ